MAATGQERRDAGLGHCPQTSIRTAGDCHHLLLGSRPLVGRDSGLRIQGNIVGPRSNGEAPNAHQSGPFDGAASRRITPRSLDLAKTIG